MKYSEYKYIYRHPYYDRYFSQIMRHLLSFFVSKLMNITHIHTKFNPPKYPKDHEDEDINLFFSKLFETNMLLDITDDSTNLSVNNLLKNKQIFSLPDQNLAKLYDINDIFNDKHIDLLKSSYKLKKHCIKFDPKVLNIAVHIRRGDAKYEFGGSYTPLSFFIKTIKTLQDTFDNKINYQVHVYSNSPIDLPFNNISYHINEDELTTIHDIISSDIFIMSIGSNLSHFGCLLNNGINYLDKSKLIDCFNNRYNIYWCKFRNITIDESEFIEKIKLLKDVYPNKIL
jgi:hypothetical protein